MSKRDNLKKIAAVASELSTESTKEGEFEIKSIEIEEKKGNVDSILITPFSKRQKPLIVNLFKTENEVVIIAQTQAAYRFAETLKEECSGKMADYFFSASM